jgi:hypothetical protein
MMANPDMITELTGTVVGRLFHTTSPHGEARP